MGVEFGRPPLDANPVRIVASLRSVQGDGAPQSIGTPAQWATTTPVSDMVSGAGKDGLAVSGGAEGAITFTSTDDGNGSSAQYLNEPVGLPALQAGTPLQTRDDLGFLTASSIDGQTARVRPVGSITFVPQVGTNAILVDLGLAAAQAGGLQGSAAVWLSADDPGREKALVAALARHDITVVTRQSSAQMLSQFTHSSPAWSAQLTIVVAVLSALIAAALLVLLLISSRRSRLRDMSAGRLMGLSRGHGGAHAAGGDGGRRGRRRGARSGGRASSACGCRCRRCRSSAATPRCRCPPSSRWCGRGCSAARSPCWSCSCVAAGTAARRVAADVQPDAVFGER